MAHSALEKIAEKYIHFILCFALSWAKSFHNLKKKAILNQSSGPLYSVLRLKAKTSKE